MKFIYKAISFTIIIIGTLSCGGGSSEQTKQGLFIPPSNVAVSSLTISSTSKELEIGQTFQLTATINPSNATDKNISWHSSNSNVATITPTGLVSALLEGTTTITAVAGGKSASCNIIVKKPFIPVSSVELNINEVALDVQQNPTITLTATVKPDNATDKSIEWTSSNTDVATVSNGIVKAIEAGNTIITAKASSKTATCIVKVTAPLRAVDLGLSVKWANRNLGAKAPEEFGDYYAWGETTTKSYYWWSTYKWCTGTTVTNEHLPDKLTKYNINTKYGQVDDKKKLEPSDDAAHIILGGSWRMPTSGEFSELLQNCTMVWTTLNGVNGYRLTSKKNGNSIFLPAADEKNQDSVYYAGSYGYYWSSSLYYGWESYLAQTLTFSSTMQFSGAGNRCFGKTIRAVSE